MGIQEIRQKLADVVHTNPTARPQVGKMVMRSPKEAFERAVKDGRLSRELGAINRASEYMYMGTRVVEGLPDYDMFKHQMDRTYLP